MAERFTADFGRAAADYRRHRAGFPEAFFARLEAMGVGLAGQRMVDLGTGTGSLARRFAGAGARVVAVDASAEMLEAGRAMAAEEGATVDFRQASAEASGLEAGAFDAVVAGQCWHWFDHHRALAEAERLLCAGRRLAIGYFSWVPEAGSVVAATEELIVAHNPDWPYAGGVGYPPRLAERLAAAGFTGAETMCFDLDQPYDHVSWRGRIRASAGVGGSLEADRVGAFDAELARLLAERFPDQPLLVPHRCWALVWRKAPG